MSMIKEFKYSLKEGFLKKKAARGGVSTVTLTLTMRIAPNSLRTRLHLGDVLVKERDIKVDVLRTVLTLPLG